MAIGKTDEGLKRVVGVQGLALSMVNITIGAGIFVLPAIVSMALGVFGLAGYPMKRFKGRIQVGADADITIFNPNTIIDKATFEKGLEFSAGIEYVIVNGNFILKNGKTVNNVFPGQAVYGKFKK